MKRMIDLSRYWNGPVTERCVEDYRDRLVRRFWDKVDKSLGQGPKGDCWLWVGSRTALPRDYGHMTVKMRDGRNRPERASILSYQIHFGAIPKGLFVCHECDNPPCVRPEHLWLGTQLDNMKDAQLKGRVPIAAARPKPNPRVQITTELGGEIRTARRRLGLSLFVVANLTGLHYSYISLLERGHRRSMAIQCYVALRAALDL